MLQIELPRPGNRARTPLLHGSSDAFLIARTARARRPLAVFTAAGSEAQRLLEEIPYFDPGLKVHLLPDWETLPYDQLSPHQDLVSERLETLHQLMRQVFDVAIIPVTTALLRLAPVEYLAGRSFYFKQGEKLAPAELRTQLVTAGYAHVTQVVAPGEYCVRGGLIDIFPTGSALPYRIELDDDLIESIRSFDADTQRSIYKVNEVRLLPAREFPLDEDGQTQFRKNFREKFEGDPSRSPVYKDISKGVPTAGIEYFLPLFFDRTAVITDYLPPETLLFVQPGLQQAIEQFWSDTHARYAVLRGDLAHPVLPPHDLYQTADEFLGSIKPYARVELESSADRGSGIADGVQPSHESRVTSHAAAATAALPPLAVERRANDPLHLFKSFAASFKGRILVLAETAGRRETMLEYFSTNGITPARAAGFAPFLDSSDKLALDTGALRAGFITADPPLAVITEN
jgi:transcription-repair coupling factor (superfamily II helicase)